MDTLSGRKQGLQMINIGRVSEEAVTRRTRNAVVLHWARGFESHTLRFRFLIKNPYKSMDFGVLFLFVKSIKVRYCGVLTSSEADLSAFSAESPSRICVNSSRYSSDRA